MTEKHSGPDALTGATGAGAEFRKLATAEHRPQDPYSQDLMRRAALGYVRRFGFSALPLWWIQDGGCACSRGKHCGRSSGKHPCSLLVPHGLRQATRDPEQLDAMWRRCPLANIGIPAG